MGAMGRMDDGRQLTLVLESEQPKPRPMPNMEPAVQQLKDRLQELRKSPLRKRGK